MLIESAIRRLSPPEGWIWQNAEAIRGKWLPRPDYSVSDLQEHLDKLAKLLSALREEYVQKANALREAQATASELIDIGKVDKDLGPALAHRFLSMFLSQTPKDIRALKKAIEARNHSDVANLANKLKSVSETLHTDRMRINCIWLEQAALEKDWSGVQRLSEQFEESFLELHEYLGATGRYSISPPTVSSSSD